MSTYISARSFSSTERHCDLEIQKLDGWVPPVDDRDPEKVTRIQVSQPGRSLLQITSKGEVSGEDPALAAQIIYDEFSRMQRTMVALTAEEVDDLLTAFRF